MATLWINEAACAGMPLNYFFDDYIVDENINKEINKLCNTCPVKKQCLNFGKYTKSSGVWGGKWLMYGNPSDISMMEVDDDV